MKKILFFASLTILVTLPCLATDYDCERPTSCTTCRQPAPWLPANCTDVTYDAHCSCQNNPVAWLDCSAWDSCDYTGQPPCRNPTPEGECPAGSGWNWFSAPGSGEVGKISKPEEGAQVVDTVEDLEDDGKAE